MATAAQRFEADKKFAYRALQDARQYVTDFDRTGSKAEALYERLARAANMLYPWTTDGTEAQAQKAIEYRQEIMSILSDKIGPASRRAFREQGGSRDHATKRQLQVGSRVELPPRSSYREADPDVGFEGDTQGEIVKIKNDAAWVRMDSDRMDWFKLADLRVVPSGRSHAKKKSPVQLQREIDEVLAKPVTASKETSVLPPSVRVARAGLEQAREYGLKNLRYGLYRHAGDRMYQWGNFTGTPEHVITAVVPSAKNTASQEALIRALKWRR